MQIRCPHCHNPMDMINDDPSSDVSCPSCGSCFNLAKELETAQDDGTHGKWLGHFQLLHCLGQGAFGAVWKARDTKLDRIVAIKIPRKERLTEADAEKFLREARAAAQVRHPNIVSVHEVGREGGRVYIASDYIDGASLDEWVEAHPLTIRESAELCAKIAEALHHAHEAGVVHRDLKPQNILVRAESQTTSSPLPLLSSTPPPLNLLTPFITDFGLAKRDAGEITMTVEGAILGTPAYMPPEQARGEAHHADRRSDVYSLGVILFRLLTGELPFRGKSQMLIVQILNEEPPALRKLDARLPRDVETICLKCLEKDPARRYQSAAELAADLRCWLTGHPISARPVSRIEQAWRWCRRNPAVASLSATVVLVLLMGMAVSSFFALQSAARNRDLQKETDRANREALKAQAQAEDAQQQKALAELKTGEALAQTARADAKADEARRSLYSAQMNLVPRDWEDAQVGLVRALLDKTRPAPGEPDNVRGFEWHYWDRLCHSSLRDLTGHSDVVRSVAFSPDGKLLASASFDGTIIVWDTTSGQAAHTLKGHAGLVQNVAFSPDGNRLASASGDKTVKVWDVAAFARTRAIPSPATSGQTPLTLKGHTGGVESVAFSPDGKRLASASGDKTVKLWDATSGEAMLTLKGHAGWIYSVAFASDGKRLASASDDQTVKVWDAASGQELLTLKGHSRPVQSVAFRPDGERIASASDDQTVKVWEASSGHELLTLKGHTGSVSCVVFSADGKRLASASWDQTVKVWDATSGQLIFTLKGHTLGVLSVALSADGKQLASAGEDQIVKLWDAVHGQEPLTLKGHEDRVNRVAFRSDGKQLASASHDHTVKLWEVASGEETLTLIGHAGPVTSVALSTDGTRLASASHDQTVKLWDTTSGKEMLTFKGHTHWVTSVALSADGKQLASGSGDQTIKLWDAISGQETHTLKGHTDLVTSVTFRTDGKRLASASLDGLIKIWDATNGREFLTLKGDTGPIQCVTFSPDEKRLASASHDRTVKVWDATNGQELLALKGHRDLVQCVAFSSDGKRLASVSKDQTIKVWDASNGQETLTLKGHTSEVSCVAFSTDGTRLASASDDGLVKVWDARPRVPSLSLVTPDSRSPIAHHPEKK